MTATAHRACGLVNDRARERWQRRLVDALTKRMAGKDDADHLLALKVLAKDLEESHARLLEQLERVEQGIAQLGKGTWTVRDITIWHSNIRAAIVAAKELQLRQSEGEMKSREPLPYKRVGHCCGPCKWPGDQVLYRVGALERWRCADCYFKETGAHP